MWHVRLHVCVALCGLAQVSCLSVALGRSKEWPGVGDRWDQERLNSSSGPEFLNVGLPSCAAEQELVGELFLLADDRAAVRCCGRLGDGSRTLCAAPDHIRTADANYSQAKAVCDSLGQRLCTKDELQRGSCCEADSSLNARLVWTSSQVRPEVALLARPRHSNADYDMLISSPDEITCKLKAEVGDVRKGMRVMGMDWISMPMSFDTCSVVGSSGVLSFHRYGEEIDAASMVMRFNNAPTAGFEDIVGRRTTVRVVNEKILANWEESVDLDILDELVTYVSTCAICNVGKSELVNRTELQSRRHTIHTRYPGVDMYASNLVAEAALDGFFKSHYGVLERSPAGVTTGSLGVALALSMCKTVKLYGMAQSLTMGSAYNYYDPESTSLKTKHWHRSWESEKFLWRSIARNHGDAVDVDHGDVAVLQGFAGVSC